MPNPTVASDCIKTAKAKYGKPCNGVRIRDIRPDAIRVWPDRDGDSMVSAGKDPTVMLNYTGNVKGVIVNPRYKPCNMAGCTGMRLRVRWPDGTYSHPCSKGCKTIDEDTLQIQ